MSISSDNNTRRQTANETSRYVADTEAVREFKRRQATGQKREMQNMDSAVAFASSVEVDKT